MQEFFYCFVRAKGILKKRKYNQAAADRNASFTPFIVSVDRFFIGEYTLARMLLTVAVAVCVA